MNRILACVACAILLPAALPLVLGQDRGEPAKLVPQAAGDAKPVKITGTLTRDDPLDAKLKHPSKVHEFKMAKGQSFVIRLAGQDFDAYLIVQDSLKQELAFNDDDPDVPGTLNSKLIFIAPKDDVYRIIATSIDNKVGKYELSILPATELEVLAAKAAALNAEAGKLYQSGKPKEAASKAIEALEIRRKLYPKDRYPQGHPGLAQSLNNLGLLLQAQGDYAKAEPYYREALAMQQAFYPKDRYPQGHPNLAGGLNNLGFLLEAQGEYAKAEPYYRDALAMDQALYTKDRYPQGHPNLALSLSNLGALLQAQGEYAKAGPYYRDALAMRQALYPKDRYSQGHPDLALSLDNLGGLLKAQGEYAKAEPYYRDALAMCQALYPKDRYPQGHPHLATSLNNLGGLLKAQGEYAKAELYYRDALAMRQALYPKDRYLQGHPGLALSLNNLGLLLQAQGEYAKAEPYYRDALAMQQALYAKDRYPQGHPDLALSLNNLGLLLQAQGEYAKAEPYYRDALAMKQALYPKDRYPQGHPHLALSLNNLGVLLEVQGEYAKAEPYYHDALAMWQALYPKDRYSQGHPDLALSLDNLGGLLQAQGDYAKAEPYLRDALAMQQALYPKDRYPQGHPELAGSLNNLGGLHQVQGEYAKAEPYWSDALAMQQALYPKDRYPQGHPDLATSLNNLGGLLQAQGDYAKAEPYSRDALAMRHELYPKGRYPQGHPDLAQSLNNVGAVLQAQWEYAKAEPYLRDALAMQQQHYRAMAELAAEAQALNFAASLPLYLDGFLSLLRRTTEQSLGYDLVWKSRAPFTQILQRRHLESQASQDPAAKKLAAELLSTRQRLAHLLLSPGKDVAEQKKKVDQLTDVKEGLEKQLARLLNVNLPAAPTELAPEMLTKLLPEGAAFVDIVRFTDFAWDPKVPGIKGLSRTPRYMAFILLKDKPAQRIDLGEAAPMEEAWAAWRQAIVTNRPDRQAAAKLAALLWEPLQKYLPTKTRTVWITADGQLGQVPWAALPGSQPGTILLEELALAVVPHGAYLLDHLQDQPARLDAKAALLTVGGVAYEQAPAAAVPLPDFSPVPADKLVAWEALPGTLSEQAQIADLARKVLKNEPVVLQGARAGLAQVSAELPKVRFAHLATHGFFADPKFRSAFQVDDKQFLRLGSERKTAGARSPLVLSGLVLAGANLPETPQRGIMTAEAVVGLRLEDLELAVLSACETGLGESAGGEGILGLQRAFHVAGAHNVVASLWRVDDKATAALMAVFYRKLWVEHLAPLQALRQAQLYIYHHPEQIQGLAALRGIDFTAKDLPPVSKTPAAKGARAHTSQWAAFLLSGVGS